MLIKELIWKLQKHAEERQGESNGSLSGPPENCTQAQGEPLFWTQMVPLILGALQETDQNPSWLSYAWFFGG